mgnify:CR=1 FL=1
MGRPKGGKNRYYSKEEKLRIVKEEENGESASGAGRKHGINKSLVPKWVSQYREGGEDALSPKRKPGNPLVTYINRKSLDETDQLRYELALAHMEIARLKKAEEAERRDAKTTQQEKK